MSDALSGILKHLSARKMIEQGNAARNGELRQERGQATARVAISLAVLGYLITSGSPIAFDLWPPSWPVFTAGFTLLAIAVLWLTLRAPAPSRLRRTIMTAADAAAVSYLMLATGKVGVPLFAFYLWITVVNGLRFGPVAMIVSAAFSLLGFAAVVSISPVWQQLSSVSAAVFISLVALPAFTANLLRKDLAGEEMPSRRRFGRYFNRIASSILRGTTQRDSYPQSQEASTNRRTGRTLRQSIQALLTGGRLKRDDELGRERGQAVVRLMNAMLVLVYVLISHYPVDLNAGYPEWLFVVCGFVVFSIVSLSLTLLTQTPSTVRRTIMNAADVTGISYAMLTTGPVGIPLFVLYLSTTLGNGLRFGLQAMITSAALSVIGFSAVLALSPAWVDLTAFAAGVMIVLVLLPFSARLIRGIPIKGDPASSREVGPMVDPNPIEKTSLEQRLRTTMSRFHQNQADELGRERGQAAVRLVNTVLVIAYLLITRYPTDFETGYPDWLVVLSGFTAFAVLLLVSIRNDTRSSVARRLLANVADVGIVTYLMISTGATGIPLFILFLSITLGNGFRFGLEAMKLSTVLCFIGFSTVLVFSPVWRQLPVTVPAGVVLSLILLPAYAAHLIKQLARAMKRAEEASAAKSHFLARMSHELRTPLSGILGTAELLEHNKRLTREDRSMLRVIKDSVQISMRQIDNVLDFSKIEAGKLSIEQIDFDLHEVLNRAIRLVRPAALEKSLRLMLRIDPAVPYELVGDPHHLSEVLLNFLSNGVKFTENGYVSLEAGLVEADADSALVRLEVHDTGIGMEPAEIARIFEAFSQADTSTTRRYGGTGLGTTIAKQLVELMGGQLRVESAKGRGTVFSADIRFPRQARRDDEGDGAVVGPLTGARVLLVSKEPALAEYLSSSMKEWTVSVNVVASASEATGFLARSIRLGNPLHAVLADGRTVLDDSGEHCAGDFLEKASTAATPVFLVCDVAPEQALLRQWGYAAVLSYDVPPELLFNALHASYAVETQDERSVVRIEPWVWGQPGGSKPRVLVADDNRTNLMILRKILERANYEVDTAENGDEALELLRRSRYKVAVLDMHMPGRDGLGVMRDYRFSRQGARTPIVILTANGTMDAKVESADAGADAYLTKPATAGDVLSTIKKVLDETEVHELNLNRRANRASLQDVPLLNAEVISDLDRLYSSPADIGKLLDTFESESRRMVRELETAAGAKDQQRYRDLLHALKGNSANIGALRLVQACHEAERINVLEFHRDARQKVDLLERLLGETMKALRELTAAGELGPAGESDPR